MAVVENNRLKFALGYAAIGWKVIPLHHPLTSPKGTSCSCGKADCASLGKHPRTLNGLKDATSDKAAIIAWWEQWPAANVGVVTGAASGIIVVDVDPRHGGDASIRDLTDSYGEIETSEASTGGGGLHLIFAHPGVTIGNKTNNPGAGLDIRGDGGYIVAPPSLHASGNRYAWTHSPRDIVPAPLPAWMLAMLTEKPKAAKAPDQHSPDETAQHWLGKALAKANEGNRNATGLWLACQLRDSGLSESKAEWTLKAYADRAPRGEKAYAVHEAMASLKSAYSAPPREPAKGPAPTPHKQLAPVDAPTSTCASAELNDHLNAIMRGEVYNVAWPWPELTFLTQALLPSSVTVVCGDPGVGKTFWVLQCLQHWVNEGESPAVFFVEKDRKFHTMRLLAQLEGNGHFVDFDWIEQNPETVSTAMALHAAKIDELGKMISSAPEEWVTLNAISGWILQMASAGKRIIVVDPISAADAGRDRWLADNVFIDRVNKIVRAHGCSLVLITHPKKGNRPGMPTAHDMSGGAAYGNFVDVGLWLFKPKKLRSVVTKTRHGPCSQKLGLFVQMQKTRNGRGAGMEIGFTFDHSLKFAEQGLVLKEKQCADEDEVP